MEPFHIANAKLLPRMPCDMAITVTIYQAIDGWHPAEEQRCCPADSRRGAWVAPEMDILE
jgi:hypothetical protein